MKQPFMNICEVYLLAVISISGPWRRRATALRTETAGKWVQCLTLDVFVGVSVKMTDHLPKRRHFYGISVVGGKNVGGKKGKLRIFPRQRAFRRKISQIRFGHFYGENARGKRTHGFCGRKRTSNTQRAVHD